MLSTNTAGRRGRAALPEALLPLLFCITGLLAGCADNPSAIRDPGEEKRALQCGPGETLSCVEKMGKVVSCRCSNRDDLRRILEPDKH